MTNDSSKEPEMVYQERAMLVLSGATYLTEGPEVTSDCPVCQQERARFATQLSAHTIWLLILRLWTFRTVSARCLSCDHWCRVKLTDLELVKMSSPEQLATVLIPLRYQDWTWSGRLWALASVLLCWIPALGLVVTLVAWRQTRFMLNGLASLFVVAALVLASLMTTILLAVVGSGLVKALA